MKELQSPRPHWRSLAGSCLMFWPSHFLSSVCKFSVTRAGMHSRRYILGGMLLYKQDHIFASGQLLGSCFTWAALLAEGCQNRQYCQSFHITPNPNLLIWKSPGNSQLFFTDVPHTDLHKVKRGEQRRLFTLTLSEWYFLLGNLLSNNFFCYHKGYCQYCMFVLR